MKKIRLFLSITVAVMIIGMGCSNSTSSTTKEDSTVKKDTIDRDPESFSAPH